MDEAQSIASSLWLLPYVTVLLAAACITAGLGHAYRAHWLWRHRNTRPNPEMAKILEGVKPPPYAIYAALWLVAGVLLTGLTVILWGMA